MASGGVGGSDEGFISFAFAIVSALLIVMFIPRIIRTIRGTVLFYRAPQKLRAEMENPLRDMYDSLVYLPKVVRTIAADPAVVVAGAKVCMKEKVYFTRCALPKFLKFVIRPVIFLPILWFILLSSTVYSSLSFDPHSILGLPASAGTSDIKKAYRALSKRYHPDHNKTDAARDIYVQIRRAYKALVDRDAFEEDEARNTHEFSVGVALPSFLTSREHDGLVLFGLLAVLILVPFYVWYKFTNDKRLPRLVWHIRFDKERVEHFMKHFGIPEDPKYVDRRDSRQTILRTLISLCILPANVRPDFVKNFPPFPDFIQRCIEADKNRTFLSKLGFNDEAISALQAAMVANGVKLMEEYLKRTENNEGFFEEVQLLSHSAYVATRFLFMQHTIQVDKALQELQEHVGNLASARKLLNLHEEMYDLLDLVYRSEKPNKNVIAKLVAMPQRTSDLVDAIEPEIQQVYQRYYKNLMQESNRQRKKEARVGRGA